MFTPQLKPTLTKSLKPKSELSNETYLCLDQDRSIRIWVNLTRSRMHGTPLIFVQIRIERSRSKQKYSVTFFAEAELFLNFFCLPYNTLIPIKIQLEFLILGLFFKFCSEIKVCIENDFNI